MINLENPAGDRAALALFIISIIIILGVLIAVSYNLYVLIKKFMKRPTRIKAYFTGQSTLVILLLILRLLHQTIPKNLIILYGTNIVTFSASLYSIIIMLEILKLFVILTEYLTEKIIVLAQYFSVCCHFLLLWGMLTFGTLYESTTDNSLAAKWFRYSIVISVALQSVFYISVAIIMTKLITNSIQNEEDRVRNFALKYDRLLLHIRLVGIVEILNIILMVIAVILDGPLGSNGKSLYRSISTIFIANAAFIVILCPVVFDGIRSLKFSQDQIKEIENGDEQND